MDKKYRRLLSNTAILALGTIGSKLLVFLLLPLYTRCLTKAEYGISDIITQSANFLMPIMSLGISDAVFRYTLDKTVDRRRVLTTGFFVNIACAAVILAVYPLFDSIAYFDRYMWLIILYTFVANIHSLFAQYVRARGMTTLFAVQGILATTITVALNILFLVVFRFGVTGYVLSIVIADAAMALFMTAVVRLDYAIRPRFFDRVLTKRMLRYCVPLMPTTVFWWVTNVSDRYMIKGMIGDDVNGLYSAAFRIPTMLILLSGIFIEAWQFSAISERDESTKRAHAAFFGKVFDSYQGLLFISGAGLIAFSKIFSRILFAEDYYTAWMYMPVLIIATVYSGLVTFMGSVYLVDKKSVQSLVTSMIGAGINVILNLILIPTKLRGDRCRHRDVLLVFCSVYHTGEGHEAVHQVPSALEKACRQHDHPECTGGDNDVGRPRLDTYADTRDNDNLRAERLADNRGSYEGAEEIIGYEKGRPGLGRPFQKKRRSCM